MGAVVLASAFFLGVADAVSSPLSYTLKGDAASREENRLESDGFSAEDVKARVAKFFAALDVLLDAVGIAYPLVLGLLATYATASSLGIAFALFGFLGFCWALIW